MVSFGKLTRTGTTMFSLRYFIFLIPTFFWFTEVIADDILIVASTSPLYQEGQRLTPKTTLQLKKGEAISFRAHQNEEIYTQTGPYVEEPNADTSTLLEKIITLVSLRSTEKSNAQLNEIDILQDNAFCFNPREKIVLWRPHTTQTQTLSLKNKQTGQIATQNWLAEEATLTWSSDLPITDNGQYLVKLGEQFSKLSFYQLPDDLAPTYQANWMLDKKCVRQAKLLLN
jgi:hypothetical protein